jgi:hypothetical protein
MTPAPIATPRDLARMLTIRREELGLGHEQLETAAGLSPGQAHALERGVLHIARVDLAAVLGVLGLRLRLRQQDAA